MKAIFKVLACAAALSFFVACGASVSGDATEDAKTYNELVKAGKGEEAAEFLKAVQNEYGTTSDKYYEFNKQIGTNAAGNAMEMMSEFGF